MNGEKDRELLAKANFCRSFLYITGFMTQREMERVHARIIKWQKRQNVVISEAQLLSVCVSYDDNVEEVR